MSKLPTENTLSAARKFSLCVPNNIQCAHPGRRRNYSYYVATSTVPTVALLEDVPSRENAVILSYAVQLSSTVLVYCTAVANTY